MPAKHWYELTGDMALKLRTGDDATFSPDPDPDPPGEDPPYAVTRSFRVQPDAVSATVTGHPTYCKIDDAIMLQSLNSGLDVRISLDDTAGDPVAWDLIAFSGQVWEAWVRVPSITTAGVTMAIRVGRAADDQSFASGTWSGWLAAWDGDGVDRTGNGRSLTGASAGTGAVDATSLDGTEYLSTATFNWLTGHSAIGVRALVRATAGMIGSDRGWLSQGPVGAGGGAFTLVNRWRPLATSGGAANCMFAYIRTTAGGALYNSGSNVHKSGLSLYHTSWTSGEAPIVHLDGLVQPASSSILSTGTTIVDGPSGGTDAVLAVGASTVDTTAYWQDRTAAVAIRPTAFTTAEAELDARTLWYSPAWTPFQVADAGGSFAAPITAPDLDPETAPPPSETTPLPPVTGTTRNVNSGTIAAALSAANPGDHIVLADGSYSRITMSRGGTEAEPIVIRAANIQQAVVAGVTVNAAHVITYGLDVTANSQIGPFSGNKWWRNRLRNCGDQAMRLDNNCSNLDIAYSEWTNITKRGLLTAAATNVTIRYCMFKDSTGSNSGNDGEAIHWSFGPPDRNTGGFIYRCKFKNWYFTDEEELISIKCSGNTLRQLTVENCQGQSINNRYGRGNRYEAIWTDSSAGIGVHDGCDASPNLVLGCRVDNIVGPSRSGIMVRAGQWPGCVINEQLLGGNNNASLATVVSGCTGDLWVGRTYSNSTQPALRTRVRQHSGSISYQLHSETDAQPGVAETLYTWSPLIWLADSDVGPFAGV